MSETTNELLRARKQTIMQIGRKGTMEDFYSATKRLILGAPYIFDGNVRKTFPSPTDPKVLEEEISKLLKADKELLVDLSPVAIFVFSKNEMLVYSEGY